MEKIINLHFKGPINVASCFNIDFSTKKATYRSLLENIEIKRNTPGFYIWGHINEGKFIPYYVGKIQSCILSRIKSHIADILKDESSYPRLSNDYLKGNNCVPFYRDDLFLKNHKETDLSKMPLWMKENFEYFKDKIIYYNNKEFFQQFRKMDKLKNDKYGRGYPINNLTINRKVDDSLISNMGSMHFAFAEYTSLATGSTLNDIFETIESHIKYRLKGKTFGSAYKFETVERKLSEMGISTIDLSCDKDLSHIFKEVASNQYYLGYLSGEK